MLRETQLGALVFSIENRHNPDFKEKYLACYEEFEKFVNTPEEALKPINTVILEEAFETEIEFLREYSDMITLVKLNMLNRKYLSDMEPLVKAANRLKIIVSPPNAELKDRHNCVAVPVRLHNGQEGLIFLQEVESPVAGTAGKRCDQLQDLRGQGNHPEVLRQSQGRPQSGQRHHEHPAPDPRKLDGQGLQEGPEQSR
jgi:hypothetical protein